MQTSTSRKARVADLRASLLDERSRITSNRQSQLQVLITPAHTAAEDQAPLLHDQFVAISAHSWDRERLASIESALARFDRGEFGICEECEGEIPLKRLQAVPWASYCVPCQERIERFRSTTTQEVLVTG
jgi:DnaK suppressor protein